jgi:glycosyltransferase involved in cell wall biosynthesis
METLFVFSHLSWDFVFQRPQQLVSRLARHYRIFFIEEPEPAGGTEEPKPPGWQASQPLPQLTVLRATGCVQKRGFNEDNVQTLFEKLSELRQQHPNCIAWLYTPMAMPLLKVLDPAVVIYDCMDELSAFMNPPDGLLENERRLLERADLVFTGGPSLYAIKQGLNANVHCFPSSVDVTHFRKALDRNSAYPPHDLLPKPRLGFFGVLDERLDVELIAAIADARPHWQLVLVGPVVKIDPASLPQRPNICYMGQQPYALLPSFLASWDVCLMPFAMNEATRFISPTKSLEYMAAELPTVSTAVRDVVEQHADVVMIAESAADFIRCCDRALSLSAGDRLHQIRQMRAKLSLTSWDTTVREMRRLMRQVADEEVRTGSGNA